METPEPKASPILFRTKTTKDGYIRIIYSQVPQKLVLLHRLLGEHLKDLV
jgi:hypothetical protein